MDINLNLLNNKTETNWRKGKQPLMQAKVEGTSPKGYNLYPHQSTEQDKIFSGCC
jgi:hypothetical protein